MIQDRRVEYVKAEKKNVYKKYSKARHSFLLKKSSFNKHIEFLELHTNKMNIHNTFYIFETIVINVKINKTKYSHSNSRINSLNRLKYNEKYSNFYLGPLEQKQEIRRLSAQKSTQIKKITAT